MLESYLLPILLMQPPLAVVSDANQVFNAVVVIIIISTTMIFDL